MKRFFTTNLSRQLFVALVILITGLLMLLYMIVVEEEPGAIPLLLTFSGLIWVAHIVHQRRKQLI